MALNSWSAFQMYMSAIAQLGSNYRSKFMRTYLCMRILVIIFGCAIFALVSYAYLSNRTNLCYVFKGFLVKINVDKLWSLPTCKFACISLNVFYIFENKLDSVTILAHSVFIFRSPFGYYVEDVLCNRNEITYRNLRCNTRMRWNCLLVNFHSILRRTCISVAYNRQVSCVRLLRFDINSFLHFSVITRVFYRSIHRFITSYNHILLNFSTSSSLSRHE